MGQQGVHYFPGHMQKALRQMKEYIKVIDLVVEILDARAPLSSRNPLLDELLGGKPRVVLLSKSDTADPEATQAWVNDFKSQAEGVLAGNLTKGKIIGLLKAAASPIIAKKREKEAKFAMKKQPIRVMVVGIPNVGKSTFINNVCGKNVAITGNKAGVTRAEQWIKINEDFTLLDTPGVLPMNYAQSEVAVRLALLGSMREDVLPTYELAKELLRYLSRYEHPLKARFDLEGVGEDYDAILTAIAKKRGLLDGSVPSIEKASYLLIKEFKDGKLGPYSLETPDA
ncbi:MAG: ribosome biogenesis GTPase YlqF [Bacilli bacterium]|nr:ribosome biogenesis GTPase YlqF [Bacilli bacterium]